MKGDIILIIFWVFLLHCKFITYTAISLLGGFTVKLQVLSRFKQWHQVINVMDEEAAPLPKDAGVICTNTVDIPHRTALIHVCIGRILKAGVEFLMLRKSWDQVSNSRFKNRYKKPKAEHQNDKKQKKQFCKVHCEPHSVRCELPLCIS